MNQTRYKLDELYCRYKEEFKKEEIVLGDGCVSSSLVIIGEAPGKDEVRLGKPFVGAAGKNLDEFINALNIDREDFFITNAIKYRLGKLNPKTQRIINRPATSNDIKINQKWLYDEINILTPQIIVTLGNVPLKAITNNFSITIGDKHGKLSICSILGHEIKLFPLYHPASIIYNRSLKDIYFQDIIKLKEIINNI